MSFEAFLLFMAIFIVVVTVAAGGMAVWAYRQSHRSFEEYSKRRDEHLKAVGRRFKP